MCWNPYQGIKVRRGVTPDTTLRLEKLFGMPAAFWLTLRWELYQAMHSPKAKEIETIRLADGIADLPKTA